MVVGIVNVRSRNTHQRNHQRRPIQVSKIKKLWQCKRNSWNVVEPRDKNYLHAEGTHQAKIIAGEEAPSAKNDLILEKRAPPPKENPATEEKSPPTKRKTLATEEKAPPTKRKTLATEEKASPTKRKTPATEEKAPPAKRKTPAAEEKAPPAKRKNPKPTKKKNSTNGTLAQAASISDADVELSEFV